MKLKQATGMSIMIVLFYSITISWLVSSNFTVATNSRKTTSSNPIESLLVLWSDTTVGTELISIHVATLIIGLALLITVFGVIHLLQEGKDHD